MKKLFILFLGLLMLVGCSKPDVQADVHESKEALMSEYIRQSIYKTTDQDAYMALFASDADKEQLGHIYRMENDYKYSSVCDLKIKDIKSIQKEKDKELVLAFCDITLRVNEKELVIPHYYAKFVIKENGKYYLSCPTKDITEEQINYIHSLDCCVEVSNKLQKIFKEEKEFLEELSKIHIKDVENAYKENYINGSKKNNS